MSYPSTCCIIIHVQGHTHTPQDGASSDEPPVEMSFDSGLVKDVVQAEVSKVEDRLRMELEKIQQQLQHLQAVVHKLASAVSSLETERQ